MELPTPAVALAIGARPVSALDPHLVVLGVLVAAWVIDKVLAAVEWLEGDGDGESSGPPFGSVEAKGDPGAPARDAGRPSGAE